MAGDINLCFAKVGSVRRCVSQTAVNSISTTKHINRSLTCFIVTKTLSVCVSVSLSVSVSVLLRRVGMCLLKQM